MTYSGFSEYAGEVETLRLKKDPFYYGLGHYEDIEGNTWDINAIINSKVCARLISGQSYYGTGTNDNSFGYHEWIPFHVECLEPKMKWTKGIDNE